MTAPVPIACLQIRTAISAYLDGELDAVACDSIEAHCATCPECATLVAGLRVTVGLCRQAGTVALPEAVRLRARERVRALLDGDSEPS